MLTYTPPSEIQPVKPTERPWLLFLLFVIWVLPGLIGHNPWKPDEPAAIAIIDAMLKSGNWLMPTLLGEPMLDRSPFYYQVAALFAKVLAPHWLAVHDAARLATGMFVALTLTFCGGAARELLGRRLGRVVVIVLIGCFGLVVRGHALSSEVATLCGFALAFYGMVLALRLPGIAGLALGVGIGLAGASASLFEPTMLALVAILLPVFFRYWRTREYLMTLVLGGLLALPWLVLWPLWLWKSSPELFVQWWLQGATVRFQGYGEFGLLREIWYYLSILPWFAWPALPLAAWTLWDARLLGYAKPHIQFPLRVLGLMLTAMMFSPLPREGYALPLLIPFAFLAGAGVDRLRRGAAAALNWFGIMAFGSLAIYMWIAWSAAVFGIPARLAARGDKVAPGFEAELQSVAVLLAMLLTMAWIWAVSRRRQRGRQAVTSWAAGVTLGWALLMLLWLPGIDWVRAYRSTALQLQAALPEQYDCVASSGVAIQQLALFAYHAPLRLHKNADAQCSYLLVQGGGDEIAPDGNWRKIWSGGRPGDRRERFRLYIKDVQQVIPL